MQPNFKVQAIICCFCISFCFGFSNANQQKSPFKIVKNIPSTPVKHQFRTSTCWSFAVCGMLESEILRDSKEVVSLSEMFIVYHTYLAKAEHYIRMHGDAGFSNGGALNDPIDVISEYGIVPYEAYTGLLDGKSLPDHFLPDLELKLLVDNVVKTKVDPTGWKQQFTSILEKYLGTIPDTFNYKGKIHTPATFAKGLKIKPENYVLISSFQYRPYYSKFIPEVPDNWSSDEAFNLPLDQFIAEIDSSISAGNTVAVTLDISEKNYDFREKGIAIVSSTDTLAEKSDHVTEKMRQTAFDNLSTTDDHALLLTGIACHNSGKKFYLAKNSWGTDHSPYKGYLYLSEEYVKYKVIAALVNKNYLSSGVQKMIMPCK